MDRDIDCFFVDVDLCRELASSLLHFLAPTGRSQLLIPLTKSKPCVPASARALDAYPLPPFHATGQLCRNGQDGRAVAAHMNLIRQRLHDESADIAKSEARWRERESKKIGRQVLLENLKGRERFNSSLQKRHGGTTQRTLIAVRSAPDYCHRFR